MTDNNATVSGILEMIQKQVDIAVKNNVAHATASTNAWRDSIGMIESSSKALSVLLLQLANAPTALQTSNGQSIIQNASHALESMELVFKTDSRTMALKKARTAIKSVLEEVNQILKQPASSPRGYNPPSQKASASDLLKQPLPNVQKGTTTFNRAGSGKDVELNDDGTFERPKMGTNIKPTQHMTFSSAESSASARLGVTGRCVSCNASRNASDGAICPSCGKNSNIVF
eukprot:TRINITY_DN16247_c0_g1_i1.p1 TRINITY_DN16247_c0_g1~~TRINITY_DN16247_c0_g1_i1.p1  ORF type:complete len:245 (-),score=37.56 TRINITY_DN16247_c0_g1_i1:44-733(-)